MAERAIKSRIPFGLGRAGERIKHARAGEAPVLLGREESPC